MPRREFSIPKLEDLYRQAGAQELPGITQLAVNWFCFITLKWWIWTLPLGGAWFWFEWKHQGENKMRIRIAAASAGSLVMGVVMFFSAFAVICAFLVLPVYYSPQEFEARVLDHVEQAVDSYAALEEAIDEEDWDNAREAAWNMRASFRSLGGMHVGVAMLTGLRGNGGAEEIQRLTREIAELSDDVHDSIRDGALSHATANFEDLKNAYEELVSLVPDWPSESSMVLPETEALPRPLSEVPNEDRENP